LLETTPDYNPTPNSPSKTAAGVDLASVRISPSRWLWLCTLIVYSSMLLSASLAIFPFLLSAFYWPILWLVFFVLIIVALRSAWRAQQRPSLVLTVTQKIWRLQTEGGEVIVQLYDEVLMWSGVIIFQVQETVTHRKHRIVALPDSMNASDWRRLRVWLRMGLRKNS
jgi:hypothetical protein